jgi:hypothetical protein
MLKTILLLATATTGTPNAENLATRDATASRSVEFLGLRFCTGAHVRSDCDVQLFSTPNASKISGEDSTPMKVSLFGKMVCVGNVPASDSCELKLGRVE